MKPFVAFLRLLIRSGTLIVIDADGERHRFGEPDSAEKVTMRFHDRRPYWQLVTSPTMALGEGFMNGTMTPEDGTTLYALLTLLMRNKSQQSAVGWLGMIDDMARAIHRTLLFNPIGRARRNVAHHYDLGNDLFNLFLDTDRQYSCAYFRSPNDTLEQAQANKKELIARKLVLKPGMRVLDIGSGWGGLGLYLAQAYGADVTGLTLSQEQLAASNARAKAAGIDHRCRFVMRDYRQETGVYDRVVSVGMFEHVGLQHYGAYFKGLARMLNDDGVALIHSIGAVDRPAPSPEWIDRYIFPGTYVPTPAQMLSASQKVRLRATDMEIWRLHYAETLRHWRMRFMANRERAKALYDERFCRMWEFYFTCCEVAFRIGDLMVIQLQLAKRQDAVPLTRDYLMVDTARVDMQARPRAV
jgi:cyclopropane-fatty-acyl-phospholipid synthase